MLDAICNYLNNFFVKTIKKGTYTIADSTITLDCADGQYYRIVGSVFNDGIYKYPSTDLTDETFDGEIWTLAIPKELLELTTKITDFNTENKKSVYNSESFGGYSYSKATNNDGVEVGWQDAFKNDLKAYKKI